MQDGFLDVFEPVNVPDFSNAEGVARIADRIEAHRFDARPMLEGARVAIFGVNDGRRSGDNEGCAAAPDAIREWFYQLVPHGAWKPTVDLGNIRAGADEADTYAAVHSVVAELVQMGIVPIVLGGGRPDHPAVPRLGIRRTPHECGHGRPSAWTSAATPKWSARGIS